MTRARWAVVVLLSLALVVGGAYLWRQHRQDVRLADECRRIEAINAERHDERPVTEGEQRVVVLGDSYSQGYGLDQPRDSWPTPYGEATGAQVYVNAVGGSGLTGSTYCPGEEFGRRVSDVNRMHPDAVIVQTGLNDVGADSGRLGRALTSVLDGVDAREVVVGPAPAPQRDRAQVAAVDRTLRRASSAAGVPYVSLLDLDLTYLPDGVHPDAAGQAAIGRFVARRTARGRSPRP